MWLPPVTVINTLMNVHATRFSSADQFSAYRWWMELFFDTCCRLTRKHQVAKNHVNYFKRSTVDCTFSLLVFYLKLLRVEVFQSLRINVYEELPFCFMHAWKMETGGLLHKWDTCFQIGRKVHAGSFDLRVFL